MSTSVLSPSGIRVSLKNVDMWEKFYPDNEMVVTRAGRKLFPDLRVKVEGLVPDVLYNVSFHLERVGNYKYTYRKDLESGIFSWEEVSPVNEPFPIQKRNHIYGATLGAHWANFSVSFTSIYITNNSNFDQNSKMNPIILESMHKYQPVVTVQRLDNGWEEEFRLTMTEFMAVTAFQNLRISDLKKQNNPRARYQDSSSQNRKRAITSENSPPSTVATSVGIPATSTSFTKTVAPPFKKPMHSQNQMMTPPAISIASSTMVTPSSFTSAPTDPSFRGHNNFQNQMMTPSTMAAPPSMAPTSMNQLHWGSADFHNPMMAQQTMTPHHMVTSPAHDIAMNQNYDPYGTWNVSQMGGVPMPPQAQWNMMPDDNHPQDFAQFGSTSGMQQMNYDFQQFTDFNGVGTPTQQYSYEANFEFH
ncbi:unnamed protein product [Caenorhabditis brenneri]